ncbi:NUDIX domain-containing protein [Nocardioides pocheonensis]|uniref:NUDIX hydrolase n=1 Tax=Nocardioides pocheonensis TaxID=661485 RepID=A0A3N0GGC1_9ACTN|nr:NUDIX hydrolase [Nocardioides pocheonensis]RNM11080.1 NUDIX hydrolase [Nocardioides pocheonensis]
MSEGVPPDRSLADEPQSWPVVDSQDLHRDEWVVAFRADTMHRPEHPDEQFRRLVVEDPGAAIVLAIDDDERVVVVRQYRHPVQMRLVELPAGKLDMEGEDPLVAAARELREEVGVRAREWTHLMTTYASPGITAETHALYLARGLEDVDRDFDLHHEEADMTVERVPFAELLDAVLDGRVADAPVATAVLAYEVLRGRGRL